MGYLRSHAIVVTSHFDGHAEIAHKIAAECGLEDLSTAVTRTRINGGGSFAVLPDGSKEGWDESDLADRQRAAFIAKLRELETESVYVHWVEVMFADDNDEVRICSSSSEDEQ